MENLDRKYYIFDTSIKIHVDRRGHANLDSLPFRYGFYYDKDTKLDLYNCKNWVKKDFYNQKKNKAETRYILDANFLDRSGEERYGHFILGDHGFSTLNLVTVFQNDIDQERKLSDLLTKLRKEKKMTPDRFVDLNPYYLNGEANTVHGFISLMDNLAKTNERKSQTLGTQLDDAISIAEEEQRKRKLAEQEKEEAIKQSKLKDEIIEQLGRKIKAEGNEFDFSPSLTLENVYKAKRTKSNGSEVDCIYLKFKETSTIRKMDTNFDSDEKIYNKAKTLIDKKVLTIVWKPKIFNPLHWFKDIFEDTTTRTSSKTRQLGDLIINT